MEITRLTLECRHYGDQNHFVCECPYPSKKTHFVGVNKFPPITATVSNTLILEYMSECWKGILIEYEESKRSSTLDSGSLRL